MLCRSLIPCGKDSVVFGGTLQSKFFSKNSIITKTEAYKSCWLYKYCIVIFVAVSVTCWCYIYNKIVLPCSQELKLVFRFSAHYVRRFILFIFSTFICI